MNSAKKAAVDIAARALAAVDQLAIWKQLLKSADEKIRIEALKYLTDRAHGRPAQAINLGGSEGGPLEIFFGGTPPPWAGKK